MKVVVENNKSNISSLYSSLLSHSLARSRTQTLSVSLSLVCPSSTALQIELRHFFGRNRHFSLMEFRLGIIRNL